MYVILGVSVLLLIVLLLFTQGGGESGVNVETATAQFRSVTQKVTGSGKVRPEIEVPISSEVSGEIVFLGVQEGDIVQEGQLLVRIRGDFYTAQRAQAEAGLLQARAGLARAQAELIQAEADLNRTRSLAERGVVAAADLESAQTRYDVAQAGEEGARYQVQSAEASLSQATDQLQRTSIYAPMSGTVSMLSVELGERVVGTAQMTGTEIMRIAELEDMELEVDINENDVVNITLGDSALVVVDAYPDRPIRGVVTQIANSARVTGMGTQDQVTSFPVNIRLERIADNDTVQDGLVAADIVEAENPDTLPILRPGMSGTVDIFTRTLDRVVAVPIQAVTVRDFNALAGPSVEDESGRVQEDFRRVVFVVRDGRAIMVEVETSIADDTHIAITRGLEGSEEIVTGPFRMLRTELSDSSAVIVRDRPAPSAIGS